MDYRYPPTAATNVAIEQVVLTKFQLAQLFAMPPRVDVVQAINHAGLEVRVVQHIAAQELKEVSETFPATWFDGFKITYFPKWLLKRYPAKMRSVKLEARVLYPMIAFPDQRNHLYMTKFTSTPWSTEEE